MKTVVSTTGKGLKKLEMAIGAFFADIPDNECRIEDFSENVDLIFTKDVNSKGEIHTKVTISLVDREPSMGLNARLNRWQDWENT